MNDAHVVYLVLGSLLVLFVYERWRYDIVALIGLFALVLAGIVPAETAFTGFSHPAVVTVAAVLVVSQGLARCGVVDAVALLLQRVGSSTSAQVLTLTAVVTVCSALMNNVGALALLMPVAMRLAQRHEIPVSQLLMPLAFGSLLGGMTTLIGTPPNLIVGGFRADTFGEGYGFFAYAPVGIGVAVVGVLFMGLFGWRLLPRRTGQGSVDELF
ncbi:MAG: SLC13 family permease, partial [Acidobacteriota bacterium]